MKISVICNPFEGSITIRGISGTSEDYYKIAELVETTIKQDIRTYFLAKQVISDIHRLGKGGGVNENS